MPFERLRFSNPYLVPSLLAAPWPEQPAAADLAQAGLADAPALAEVEVAPPLAVLLQHVGVTGQSLAVVPALEEVAVVLPPMAVLLAQQALAAEPPWQAFTVGAAAALLLAAASDCADAWLKKSIPQIIRLQTIKILEIDFIFLYFLMTDLYNNSLAKAKLRSFLRTYNHTLWQTHAKIS